MAELNPEAPARNHRRVSLGALLCSVAVFIAVLTSEIDESGGDLPREPTNEVASGHTNTQAQAIPLSPPDPRPSLLGTDSSTSKIEQRLVLASVSPGATPREGIARLGTDPRNPQTYSAGAQLANGTVLREIHAGYVILERSGRRSLLMVSGTKAKLDKRHENIGVDASVLTVGGEEAVNRPLERIASSRGDLSEIIRPEPVFERDEFAGLKILPGTDRSRLERLDLQAGDIVRTIDGKHLESADAAWQLLDDAISTGTPIVISIEREGSLLSMSLDGLRLKNPPMHMSPADIASPIGPVGR